MDILDLWVGAARDRQGSGIPEGKRALGADPDTAGDIKHPTLQ